MTHNVYIKLYRNLFVLLTVHLSTFILVINQLDAQNLFYNNFISCLPCTGRPPIVLMMPEAV